MHTILGLSCIYDTARQSWAIELTLDEEAGRHRFPISPDQVETFVEAFDDCSKAEFDPATGEIVFAFEYEEYEDEEEEEDEGEEEEQEEEEEADGAEEETDGEDEEAVEPKKPGKGGKSAKAPGGGKRRS